MSGPTWSWSCGERGTVVRVYERSPGSVLYMAVWEPSLRNGKGDYARHSLGHRDQRRAMREARQVNARLEACGLHDGPRLGKIVDLYRENELTTKKPGTTRWIRQHLVLWENFLGRTFPVKQFGPREWERFKRERREGAIDAQGHAVPADQRHPVAPGTVNLGLDAITMVLNWACRWRIHGYPLLKWNPAWKLRRLDDANVKRSVWTQERFERLMVTAEAQTMVAEWSGRRERARSYLADVLAIAEATGRRIGAIRQLRYQDLHLDPDGQRAPHGTIRWPADSDKTGKEWLTPISLQLQRRLRALVRERPGIGAVPLFPSPRDTERPVSRDTLAMWLRQAMEAAGIPRLPQDTFHGLRRKFVVERKDLPDVDVARAGGWRSVNTMKRSYQLADDAGVLRAVLYDVKLRER